MKLKLVIFICLLATTVLAATQSGEQIMTEEESRYNAPTEKFTITMSLIKGLDIEQGAKRVIVMDMWLENKDGLQSSMIKITSPANLKGLGVLTVQSTATQTDQWLYLPDLGRSRKIASSKKSDKFMGSDITFGDFEPEVLERWNYSDTEQDNLETEAIYRIVAELRNPAEAKNYGYMSRVITLEKETFFVKQIEYFDLEHVKSKVQLNLEVVMIDKYWRANKVIVKNLLARHITVLEFTNRQINPDLPEDFFSKRYLEK